MDQSSLSTAEEALLRRTADLAVPDSPSAPTPSPLSAFDDHPTPDVDTPMIDALALSFQDSGQAEAETHVANLEVLDDKICDTLQAASNALRWLSCVSSEMKDGMDMRSSGILPAQQGAFKVEVTNLCALLQQIEVGFDMEIGSLVDAGRLAPAKGSIEDD